MKTEQYVNSPIIGPLHNCRVHPPTMSLTASAKALTTEKMSNRRRKLFMRSRDRVCMVSPDVGIPAATLVAKKLAALPLARLLSFQRRFARRASTAMHVLKKMAPDSVFRPGLEMAQRGNLLAMNACTREHQYREDRINFGPAIRLAAGRT